MMMMSSLFIGLENAICSLFVPKQLDLIRMNYLYIERYEMYNEVLM